MAPDGCFDLILRHRGDRPHLDGARPHAQQQAQIPDRFGGIEPGQFAEAFVGDRLQAVMVGGPQQLQQRLTNVRIERRARDRGVQALQGLGGGGRRDEATRGHPGLAVVLHRFPQASTKVSNHPLIQRHGVRSSISERI